MNKYNIITNIEEIILSYNKNLSYGTIISGTYFNYNKTRYITCENVYYYKGQNVIDEDYNKQLEILKNLFDNELRQVMYTDKFAVLGLPIIYKDIKQAFMNLSQTPYSIKGVVFQDLHNNKSAGIILNNQSKMTECIFKIKADLIQDIYNLYCKGTGNYENSFYNIALISDYKTSVMMNNLFRYIKENKRLDLLEESDDEEEFENINDDKFVNLKKIVYMKCLYNKKFKKWRPVEAVNFGEKLLTKQEIQLLE